MLETLEPIFVHEIKLYELNVEKIKVGKKEYCRFAVYAMTDESKAADPGNPFVQIDSTDVIHISADVRLDMVDDGVTRIYPMFTKKGFVYDPGYHRIISEETISPKEE